MGLAKEKTAAQRERDKIDGYLERFLEQLAGERYTAYTIGQYKRFLSGFCANVKAAKLRLSEMDEDQAVETLLPDGQPAYKIKYQRFMVRRFVRFLVSMGVALPPAEIAPRDPGSPTNPDCHGLRCGWNHFQRHSFPDAKTIGRRGFN